MKVYLISMMNAFVLMTLGLLGYFGSETLSPVTLIPVFVGALLLSLMKGVKSGNRSIASFSFILTLLGLVGLINPFGDAIALADNGAITRIAIMMISSLVALFYFVMSFFKVRKGSVKIKG